MSGSLSMGGAAASVDQRLSHSSLPFTGPSRLRTAKQRARLRAVEIQQLAAVCSFDSYKSDPLAVMRQHLHNAAMAQSQQVNAAAARERKEGRKKGKA